MRGIVRGDAFKCKGKQPKEEDGPFQRNEWRDGICLHVRTCPNKQCDGVTRPEEQQDGGGGPCSEMVETSQKHGKEKRERFECMG